MGYVDYRRLREQERVLRAFDRRPDPACRACAQPLSGRRRVIALSERWPDKYVKVHPECLILGDVDCG